MAFAFSCVIGRDGTILADAGHPQGCVSRRVDLNLPNLMECLYAGVGQGLIKEQGRLLAADRRPELIPAASREVYNLEIEAEQSLDFTVSPGAPSPLA